MPQDNSTVSSPWVPQEDGTTLPSPELLSAVRSNPAKYPNAVEDFATLSGKSTDEVQAIINNNAGIGTDLAQGLITGAGIATEKVGQLAGYAGLDGVEETLKSGGGSIKDFSDSLDPKFANEEKGLGETITEGIGQAVPVIGAAFTGVAGSGLLAGAAVASVAGFFTFEDEDNLVEVANDLADGLVPDFLIIDPKNDSEGVQSVKGMANNLISEFALAGLGNVALRVYKAMKSAKTPEAAKEALETIAEEADVSIKDVTPGDTETAAQSALGTIEDIIKGTDNTKPSAETVEAVIKDAADEDVAATIAAKEAGVDPEVPDMPREELKEFLSTTFGTLDAEIKRSRSINSSKAARAEMAEVMTGPNGRKAYVKNSEKIAVAIMKRDYDEVTKLIKEAPVTMSAVRHAGWQDGITRAALQHLEVRYDKIITDLRANPSLTTRQAYKDVSADTLKAKVQLGELDRQTGTGASFILLNRKLNLQADEGMSKAFEDAADAMRAAGKDKGYTILATQSDYIEAWAKIYTDEGVNAADLALILADEFDEFAKVRQGTLASMKTNRMSRLTKAEKAQMEASVTKMIHDLHSSALLGQLSTTGLEVSSNLINNLTLPLANFVGGGAKLKPGMLRARREYSGYIAGWNNAWNTFKKTMQKGKPVTDDIDLFDGAHSARLDVERLWDEKKYAKWFATRAWKAAADLSNASSESQKAWRAFGMKFADAEATLMKSGMSKKDAQKGAAKIAQGIFNDKGAVTDLAIKLDMSRTSWQSVVDSRYMTGKAAQGIENLRNSRNPIISTMSRATIPFFRTLINIGGDAAQMVMPPSFMIRGLAEVSTAARLPGFLHIENSARFIDDFTGKNGVRARVRAQARQRMGASLMLATYAMVESGSIEITPPGGYQSWNAKIAKWETAPGSSLIIGDTIVDLTRFLPFSAPLLMVGIMRDQSRRIDLEMEGGEYSGGDINADKVFSILGGAYGMFMTSLMSDAGSMRGVGELFGAIQSAVSDGDVYKLSKFGTGYLKQFMPGIPRMVGKNSGAITGDWDMYRGEAFLGEVMSSAGLPWGKQYKRLDFIGNTVQDKGRGLDPFNMKDTKIKSDALYSEYARLNNDTELSMILPTPDRVFDKTFWENLGVNKRSIFERIFEVNPASLNQLKTRDGRNAYDVYRNVIYKGKARTTVARSATGKDGVNIGKVEIRAGERMEDVLRRYVGWTGYKDLTPTARTTIWKTVFSFYKKNAKDVVGEIVDTPDDLFDGSRYGSPIDTPTSIDATKDAGRTLAKTVQTSRGTPRGLDQIFAIDK